LHSVECFLIIFNKTACSLTWIQCSIYICCR